VIPIFKSYKPTYMTFTRSDHCKLLQHVVDDELTIRLVIFTRRDVLANEELCISYKGVPVRYRLPDSKLSDVQDEEEVVEDKSKKSGKRRKIKKPKTTAAVHVANKKGAKEDTCHW